MRIRPATEVDAEGIAALSVAHYGGDKGPRVASFRKILANRAESEVEPILVAETDERIIGFGATRWLLASSPEDWGRGPSGWYLTGLIVAQGSRRFGVGGRLTEARLRRIRSVSPSAFYVAHPENAVSIALHARFGFVEIARGPRLAGVNFGADEGILFRADMT